MFRIIAKLFRFLGPKPCAICGSPWGACNHGN